jgi:hypothetical protein
VRPEMELTKPAAPTLGQGRSAVSAFLDFDKGGRV